MTVEQMRRKRQQFGYSCEQLSELSGVSLETVQKIFHDNEEVFSPDILKQIESVFENKRDSDRGFSYVCESKMEYGTVSYTHLAPDILCSGTGGGNRRRSGTKEPDCTAAGKAGIRRVASAAEKRRIEGGRCASV